MSEKPHTSSEGWGVGMKSGTCAICGKQTAVAIVDYAEVTQRIGTMDEPLVCNRCLVDLRGDMATELEVRRQLGNLEAKVEGYAWKQWILYFAFTLVFGALTFIAGLYLGG